MLNWLYLHLEMGDRYLGANVMLIKGISSLKFCAYVGRESDEDESKEILGLEQHKLAEQYRMMETDDGRIKAPAPSMFKQPDKKERARILQLIKSRNEKRKLIKLLEKKNINSDNRNDSLIPTEVVAQVERALKKIMEQEISSLYQEIKDLIATNSSNTLTNNTRVDSSNPGQHNRQKTVKNRWPVKPMDGDKMSAFIDQPVESDEDAAFELDELENALKTVTDGIADDRGTIDHNHMNDTSQSNEESSFSSSEEAMLHCNGVLISQPLIPETQCDDPTFSHNILQYTVDEDAYYYFIFSSANEKVQWSGLIIYNMYEWS